MHNPTEKKPWYRILYIQVIVAVFIGIVVGYLNPGLGKSLKPLGDGFINLVKMIIAPIIFCTVVHGIASMSDLKKLGRVGDQGSVLFRGGLHLRAFYRAHRRQPFAAGRGLQRRSEVARSSGDSAV